MCSVAPQCVQLTRITLLNEVDLPARGKAIEFLAHQYDAVNVGVRRQVRRTCWWVIGLPGGSSPRPPFSRFARRAVVGRGPSLL